MYQIEIITASLPTGKIGSPYQVTLEADTWPDCTIMWSCDNSLPGGLKLDKATGILSGTPIETFVSTITIRAARDDTGDSNYKRFTLIIEQAAPAEKLEIVSRKFPGLVYGQQASIELKAKGGMPPYIWSIENLPVGMKLDGNRIVGIPAMGGGEFPLQIGVKDQQGETDKYFSWLRID